MVENKTTFESLVEILLSCEHRKSVSDIKDCKRCLVRISIVIGMCIKITQKRNE